ncbi:RICIN domain-containing protein [Paraburkholderia sp. BCC1886]|uniref:RICIN domain-containing protein n=1 Tax=Paraburkholderia sp. BCC1886 TaxID=2562670 RepID=UPI0011825EB9|nr:RICIN domain-containing protein [Paraburkholderia sp. BCC1886]
MQRLRYIRIRSGFIDTCAKALLSIVFAFTFALHANPAHAQATSTLTVTGTTLCADITGESKTTGAQLITWACNGGNNQHWTLTQNNGLYQFVNVNSKLCLDIYGQSTDAGAGAQQWTCNGQANQSYKLIQQGNGYAIVASQSGLCLAAASSTAQGVQVTQQPCSGGPLQTWPISGMTVTAVPSKWTTAYNLTIVPSAAANLPDGTVVVWSADQQLDFTSGEVTPGKTYTSIFNPATGTSKQVIVTNTGHDMFCPGIVNLPDGRIFVTGGSSSDETSFYTPSTAKWSSGPLMKIPRGYQGSLTLSNGSVFTVGGSWNGGEGGKNGETWDPATGWRLNSAILADYILTQDAGGIFRQDNHAWMFAVANGRVFHAGPSVAMHWFDTTGNGNVSPAGNRGSDADAMNGNAAMYDIGKILTVGGAPSYEQSNATANATMIDISSGTAVTQTITPMHYRRAFNNSVVLPNGQVVIVGGQAFAQPFTDDAGVLAPELWDPTTKAFTVLSPQAVPRNYHSIALLLPDGRVLSGGGGLCGTCSTNHTNIEILTPPYLLNTDGTAATRPTLTSAPATAQLGTSIAVAGSSGMKAFSLMRLSSSTHSVNNEQRRVPVTFTVGTAGEYLVAIPSDPGVVVPGYYMLFGLNAKGVPSVSRTVQIQ